GWRHVSIHDNLAYTSPHDHITATSYSYANDRNIAATIAVREVACAPRPRVRRLLPAKPPRPARHAASADPSHDGGRAAAHSHSARTFYYGHSGAQPGIKLAGRRGHLCWAPDNPAPTAAL